MKTDVQTLIAALTTERDSLTKAIDALKLIRTGEPVVSATPKPKAVKASRKRSVWRIDDTHRAQIAQRMNAAKSSNESLKKTARALQREFGIKVATILNGWQRWNGQAVLSVNTPTESAELSA